MTTSLDMIRGRSNVVTLTNNSGGGLVAGDVCVQDTTADEKVTTTTSANSVLKVFVAAETIASGAAGKFYESGYCPLVNVNASVTRGRFLFTHTVAKQAAENATYGAGAFGKILKSGTTPSAIIYSATAQTSGGIARSGSTTDGHLAVWDGSNADSIKDGGSVSSGIQPNYLINGGFDVFQRQAPGTLTTIADVTYGPDRWKLTRQSVALQTARLDGTGVAGLASRNYGEFKQITNTGKFAIFQFLENVASYPLLNTTVIFQCKLKASASKTIKIALVELNTSGTADTLPAALVGTWGADTTNPTLGTNLAYIGTPASCSVTTSFAQFSFSATLPTNSKNIGVMIFTDSGFAANDILYVAEAGLFPGSTVQAWLPDLPGVQLAKCQRYFQKSWDADIAPATTWSAGAAHIIFGTSVNDGAKGITMPLGVSMRTTPTLTYYDAAGNANKLSYYNGSSWSSNNAAAATAANTQSIYVQYNGSNVQFINYAYTVEAEL